MIINIKRSLDSVNIQTGRNLLKPAKATGLRTTSPGSLIFPQKKEKPASIVLDTDILK